MSYWMGSLVVKFTEDRHKTLGLELKAIHIQFCDLRNVCGGLNNGHFQFLVNKEIGIDNAWIHSDEMTP